MGVHKRKGSSFWQYQFEIGGTLYRGSTKTTDKREALRIESQEREKILRGPVEAAVELTLGEAADAWYADEGSKMADARNNASRIRKLFGESAEGGTRAGLSRALLVHQLTDKVLLELRREREREGNSPATFNRELALLQSILRHASLLTSKLPVIAWAKLRGRESKGRLRFLSLEEETRLLNDLDPMQRYSPEDFKALPANLRRALRDQYDLAVFLLDTGGRYGEGAGVPWDVVDFKARTVNLHREKVGNEGLLGLTARLHAILVRRWNDREPGNPWIFAGFGTEGPRGYAVKGIRNAMERCGFNDPALVARLGPCTPAHTLRHTFASRLVQNGTSIYKVSKLLGHASVKTTEIYAHFAPCDAAQEAVAVLDALHAKSLSGNVVQLNGANSEEARSGSTQNPAHAASTHFVAPKVTAA